MGITQIYEEHHKKSRDLEKTFCEEHKNLAFQKLFERTNKKQILEIGCRTGTIISKFNSTNKRYGIDIDKNALKIAKDKGIEVLNVNLLENTQEFHKLFNLKKKFDVIICTDVLEHLYFPEKQIEIAHKSLTQGGYFIGNVPNAFFLKHRIRYLFGRKKFTPLEDPTHINQFNYNEISGKLQKFKFTKIYFVCSLKSKIMKILHSISPSLFDYNFFFICKK